MSIVLITGGGSGIGAGLAAAFHARGEQVIVAGRRRDKIEALAALHPGMASETVDVADADQVTALADRVAKRFPALDTVINNAGVQTLFSFTQAGPLDMAKLGAEVDINLKGLIHVTNAFLPLLKRQPAARLVNVGSGLGYVPLAAAPVYSATKAAVHSFTISLRRQLAVSPIKVIELIPPLVETDLHHDQPRKPPGMMRLDAFVEAAMAGLDAGREEIAIGLARFLRTASRVAPDLFLNIVNSSR